VNAFILIKALFVIFEDSQPKVKNGIWIFTIFNAFPVLKELEGKDMT
jgi:hypothetical protein